MAYQVSNPHAGLQRTSVFDRPSMTDEPDDEAELRCDYIARAQPCPAVNWTAWDGRSCRVRSHRACSVRWRLRTLHIRLIVWCSEADTVARLATKLLRT